MSTNPPKERTFQRKSMRYAGYDYTADGAYFITICVKNGRSSFGRIIDQEVILNPLGQLADAYWRKIPKHHPHITLDEHIIMPNHMHGILWIGRRDMLKHVQHTDNDLMCQSIGDGREDMVYHVPTVRRFGQPVAKSISTTINTYKGAVTREANRRKISYARPLWQGRFWDRIIRDEEELQRIQDYIRNNPAHWLEDKLHPMAPRNQFNQHWTNPNNNQP